MFWHRRHHRHHRRRWHCAPTARKADDAVLAECLAGFTASCNAANQQLMQAMNNFAQAAQLKAVVEFEIERRRKQLLVLPTH